MNLYFLFLKEGDDHVHHESLQSLYDGWWVLLRNWSIIRDNCRYTINLEDSTITIISSFMRTILSEPYGYRVKVQAIICVFFRFGIVLHTFCITCLVELATAELI